MKINPKILSIPPYISTSWKNIASVHVENQRPTIMLVVTLHSGARIEVPNLDPHVVEAIFAAHSLYMEQEERKVPPRAPLPAGPDDISFGLPIKGAIESFGTMLQHNPEQADSPDLHPDILKKIGQLSRTLGIEDPEAMPKAEPHCNCMHCQIARALHGGYPEEVPEVEEEVTDEDLKFKTWDVTQISDNLYTVANPLDAKEQYNVYLGEPIGCTCGEKHCEHIKAVLNS